MMIDDLWRNVFDEVNARIRYALLGVIQNGKIVLGDGNKYVGQLPQTQVSYDSVEAATSAGSDSLQDNLNHIRARLSPVETSTDKAEKLIWMGW